MLVNDFASKICPHFPPPAIGLVIFMIPIGAGEVVHKNTTVCTVPVPVVHKNTYLLTYLLDVGSGYFVSEKWLYNL